MVDDLAGMTECNVESIKLNVKIVEATKSKKLNLNEDKCHVLLFSSKSGRRGTDLFLENRKEVTLFPS